MNLNAISKSLFLLVLCAAPCYADIDREIYEYLKQEAEEKERALSPQERAMSNYLHDITKCTFDEVYANRKSMRDVVLYDKRNRINKNSNGELALRAESKIQKLTEDKGFMPTLTLFDKFNSDPDLSQAYPTDGDKFSAINDIQDRVGSGQTVRQRVEYKIEKSRDNLFDSNICIRTKALKDLEFYQDALRSLD